MVIAAAVGVWMLLLNSSALSSLTNFLWTWTVGALDGVKLVLTLGLKLGISQYALAAFVVIGFAYCLAKARSRLAELVLCIDLSRVFFNAVGDPDVKRVFSGFWYTDPERTAALVAIASVPLAAAGLYATFSFVVSFDPAFGDGARWPATLA